MAATPRADSACTWSAISEISGEITSVVPGKQARRQLKRQALAVAGRRDQQQPPRAQQLLDRLALAGAEALVAELRQRRVEVGWRKVGRGAACCGKHVAISAGTAGGCKPFFAKRFLAPVAPSGGAADARRNGDKVSEMRRARIALVASVLLGLAARAGAEPVIAALAARMPSASVSSVFHIEKSENREPSALRRAGRRALPAGRSRSRCTATGATWKSGRARSRRCLSHEQPAYGLTDPRSVRSDGEGGEVRIGLRGFPDRALTITTFREGDKCRARALTLIHKQTAMLTSIYVKLGFLFSVDYVIVRGVRVADGAAVEEKVDD